MPRLRHAVVLAICALLAGGLALFSVADPFHLRYARWFTAAFVLLAILLLTAAAGVVARRGLLRFLVVAVGVTAMVGWITLVGLASRLVSDTRVVSEVADSGRRLVVIEGSAYAIDPVYAVVVRAGSGPLEQESLVYQGLESVPAPAEARFVDTGTVEVRVGAACVYRSQVEAVTMAVLPVHRPLQAGAC